jgi:IclR helix-turn-helix domain
VTPAKGLQGIEELRDAVAEVGLRTEPAPADAGADLVVITPAGGRLLVQVKRVSLASAETVGRQFSHQDARSDDSLVVVLVADRVTEQARQMLRENGWSWLDLRGHLHLVDAGLFVDVDIPRLKEKRGPSSPLAGPVGREVAALLLLAPTTQVSLREIARMLNRAPSSVSEALASMRSAGLVDQNRHPVVPHLFWELAERWNFQSVDVGGYPSPAVSDGTGSANDVLRLGLEASPKAMGWALTDTLAAAAYGAPVAVRSDHPPDFYIPDQTVMRRALRLLDPASSHETRSATIRVAPLPMVCTERIHLIDETWPLARPLFVALDLAQDPDRGRELLDGWTPPTEAGPRVW